MGSEMCIRDRAKTIRHPIFGEVIYESLAAIYDLLERKKRHYTLFAYVRKSEDGFDENIVHIQMHFESAQERDKLWNQASEKIVESIKRGMKKAINPEERLEIENILCAIRSER